MEQGIATGLSVTLTTLPIQLWFSYEVSVYSLVLNLMVLPFMGVVLAAGLAAMLIPGFGVVGTVDLWILALYENLCLFFEKLPHAMWNPGRPQAWQMVGYYLFWWTAVWGLPLLVKRSGRSCKRQFLISVFLLSSAVGILCFPRTHVNRMTFLDVGQGDGICLQTASGEVYLFDCGSSSREKIGEKVLLPFLKYYGISEIDAVFLSHGDADHVNGLLELFTLAQEEHLTIRQVVLPQVPDNVWAETFGEVQNAIGQMENPPVVSAIRKGIGWQSSGEKDATVSFLCLHPAGIPDTGRGSALRSEPRSYVDANAASECFCITFPTDEGKGGQQAVRILLTGDVEGAGEQQLIRSLKQFGISDIDILKCPHHGSRGSTGMELLSGITPTVTVISCGKNNRYGHPHEELLDRLEAVHSTVYRTDRTGAVTVSIKRDGYRIETFW